MSTSGGAGAPKYPAEEEDRQMIVLALVQLAIARPGWAMRLRGIATEVFAAEWMYDEFMKVGGLQTKEKPGG